MIYHENTTISFHDFQEAFKNCGREEQFQNCLKELYDYLVRLEEDTGSEMELDVIDLCCNYTEYDNIYEALNDYKDMRENYYDSEELDLEGTLNNFSKATAIINTPADDDSPFIIFNS